MKVDDRARVVAMRHRQVVQDLLEQASKREADGPQRR
jgi:hypothetical protein